MARFVRSRPVIVDSFIKVLDDRSFPCTVRVSPRARYVRLEYSSPGLTVTVPRSYPLKDVPRLLEQKKHWIISMMDRHPVIAPRDVRKLEDRDVIPYLGRPLTVVKAQGRNGEVSAVVEGRQLLVATNGKHHTLEQVVAAWYRQQAAYYFEKRVRELAGASGSACGKISVRRARTRWGSCSRKGNLSFNWKLLAAPPAVIDYVIIHELAHLREMNHSPRFWKLVAARCPEWQAHRRWLKEHEANITGDFII